MCNEKDCKHEKVQPVNISARDMKVGRALFATLALRYTSGHLTAEDIASGLFNAGACMADCMAMDCPHNQEYFRALTQAIDHVDNDVPLPAYEGYEELLGEMRRAAPVPRGSALERLLGLTVGDMRGVVDTVIVDDEAGVVFEDEDEMSPGLKALYLESQAKIDAEESEALSSGLLPADGILH